MSDDETLPPEVDDEIRIRLQAFTRQVAERAETEAALGRMPRPLRPPNIRLLAIAAVAIAAVAVATVVMPDSHEVTTTDPAAAPTETTVCPNTTRPRAATPGGEMMKFAAPVAGTAAAIMLLGACADDGPTTLAKGDDVDFVGSEGLGGQTLDITAEEEDGEVTGEIRFNNDLLVVECANADVDGVVVLGGMAHPTDDPSVAPELLAFVIREGEPDSAALFGNDDGAASCTELVESISPEDALADDGGTYTDVEDGEDIEIG